ncbi:MAG: Crp/Fnr family transcriptional regulator [Bacteroidales bacterium]|nr:Crp/Fnr family transcriptional regulator [Bacteroidales bacterium]
MTDEQLTKVDTNRREVLFKTGETIFKSSGIQTHFICIQRGTVKVYLEDGKDKNILLRIAKPNEIISGPGFLVDHRHYLTATALEETTTCFVNVEDIKEVMRSNPEFSMELVKHQNEKIIRYFEKILSLTHKQTHGKIAESLLYLADHVYNNDFFETPLNRKDLADMSAMTKESAIRVLKEFEAEGIIIAGNHRFKILNKEMLRRISRTG